jgi:predicted murein hydrolase (TIGR00659 family)
MNDIFSSQAFGIMLAMLFYLFGGFLYKKTKFPIFNPLLVATIFLIIYIQIAQIDLSTFLTDLSGINVFLGPLIVSLAIPIAKQIDLIKKNWLVIVVGSVVGAITSVTSILILGPLFGLDAEIINSLIPKSSTTPIAVEISSRLGGIRAITVAVVVLTAVLGAVIVPILIKLLKIKDPRVIGMGLGTTAHAVGTAKALEIDPTAGAISGIALVVSGVATTLITLFF